MSSVWVSGEGHGGVISAVGVCDRAAQAQKCVPRGAGETGGRRRRGVKGRHWQLAECASYLWTPAVTAAAAAVAAAIGSVSLDLG